ncbi:MAG: protein kinase, partial [Rhodothermia bacterium]
LHRSVALKVLSPHLLSSEEDRARFYREARSAAALNHPNIATVHAVDETVDEDGGHHPFIAMEFIDGRSLREMIDDGPLKIEDAIRITSDTAAALHAAHLKEIVHRDVKSANVMVTKDGVVKVLDFGLAKTAQSTMLTKTGSTLGTAAYMSPEQASTMDVDHRSDIWSLGVVLYEMVAGKLPFGAAYEQAVVYSILNEDPEPLTALRTGVPMELERIVMKCLMKDAKLRYQHCDDLVADLAAIQLGHTGMRTGTMLLATSTPKRESGSALLVTLAAVVGIAAGVLATWFALPESNSAPLGDIAPTHRLTLKLPESAPLEPIGASFLGVGETALDISDDGTRLVYVGRVDGSTRLLIGDLAQGTFEALEGTEGARGPFFSPDGAWVAFHKGSTLMKVSSSGGRPVHIAEIPESMGGIWTSAGDIFTFQFQGLELVKVSSNGGSVEVVKTATRNEGLGALPAILPGNRTILLSSPVGLRSLSLDDGQTNIIHEQGSQPRFAPTGHLIFALPGRLMAAPFDYEAVALTGSPVPVAEGVRTEVVRRAAQYTFSQTGTLVYVAGVAADLAKFMVVDFEGNAEPLPFDPDYFGAFKLSPDGTKLTVHTNGASTELWIYDLVRNRKTRVAEAGTCPVIWMPDSSRFIYCQRIRADGVIERFSTPAEGGKSVKIFESDIGDQIDSISPDGKYLAAISPNKGLLSTYLIEDGNTSKPVTSTPAEGWGQFFSPNGRFLSYTSFHTGRSEVFVVPLDDSGREWQISVDGGEEALWSQDGKWLFFSNGTVWYRVPVSTDPEFSYGQPEVVVEGPYLNVPGFGYAVYPDADKIIVLESATKQGPI